MTDKLFCPKCKGEMHGPYEASNACPYQEAAYLDFYWCIKCNLPEFDHDCLTEEQVKENAMFWCSSCGKWIEGYQEQHKCKQTPSVCLHEDDGRKQTFANDTNVVTKTTEINDVDDKDAVEWINFSDRKPMIGQEIDFESYDICEETGREILSCIGMNAFYDPSEYFHKKIKKWKPAQADMISFSELTPLIKAKQAAQQELKKCPVCSGHMTYKSTRRSDVGLNEQLWQCNSCKVDCGILQPSDATVKNSLTVEKQTEECKHDYLEKQGRISNTCTCFNLTCNDCYMAFIANDGSCNKEFHLQEEPKECEHEWQGLAKVEDDGTWIYCNKCPGRKAYIAPKLKTESQIAIDKVIEALTYLSANMILEGQRTSSNWNAREEQIGIALHRFKEKLKEINK